MQELDLNSKPVVLDVGSSWAPFPLYLCAKGAQVFLSDLAEDKVRRQKGYSKRVGLEEKWDKGLASVVIQDARALALGDDLFDYVLCISTIEHILANGDIEAVKEFARVLRPGGRLILSVPYGQTYKEGRWHQFFSRTYDYRNLMARLIEPSTLRLVRLEFFIDHVTRRFTDILYYRLPKYLRLSLGWAQLPWAVRYLERDKANRDDAWLAWMVLEKGVKET
ncbi:MAG: methyltransferase domain-containing protein [Anaerolineae bacterium]|nr:methyltransferase domain-containing protein [Anaerolineae bacterium]